MFRPTSYGKADADRSVIYEFATDRVIAWYFLSPDSFRSEATDTRTRIPYSSRFIEGRGRAAAGPRVRIQVRVREGIMKVS
jgi:hypothetical protein